MYYEFDSGGGNRNILSASSNDGLVWDEDNGIRIPGANMPAAVVTGTGVRLYFNDAGTIRSATSSDGFTGLAFVEDAGDRVAPAGSGDESGGIRHPCVIRLAAGSYLMYYDATDSGGAVRIKAASSADGTTWTKQGVVIDPSMAHDKGSPLADVTFTPGAVVDGDGLIRLFFSVNEPSSRTDRMGVYMATSGNGLDFTIQPGPVVSGYTISGQNHGVQDPAPVFTDLGLRVYYWVGTGVVLNDSAIYSVKNSSLAE